MAKMSGEDGVWPIGPAANPAKPAPSARSPSMAEAGTILAHGLPCMSTNMANRNSTPSRATAATRSSLVLIGPKSPALVAEITPSDVPMGADRLLLPTPINDVALRETAIGFLSVAKCCLRVKATDDR